MQRLPEDFAEQTPLAGQEEGRFAWEQEATRGSKISDINMNVTESALSTW